jgi:hypothetical protein
MTRKLVVYMTFTSQSVQSCLPRSHRTFTAADRLARQGCTGAGPIQSRIGRSVFWSFRGATPWCMHCMSVTMTCRFHRNHTRSSVEESPSESATMVWPCGLFTPHKFTQYANPILIHTFHLTRSGLFSCWGLEILRVSIMLLTTFPSKPTLCMLHTHTAWHRILNINFTHTRRLSFWPNVYVLRFPRGR